MADTETNQHDASQKKEILKTIPEVSEKIIQTVPNLSETVISQIDIGIICIDHNGIVQLVNSYAMRYIDMMQPIGKSYQEVVPLVELNGQNDLSLIASVISGKKLQIPQNVAIRTGRGKIPISGSITPVTTDNSMLVAIIFTDDSQNILQSTQEKTFFYTAIHELRTPLTVIRFASSLLLSKLNSITHEQTVEYLTKIDKASEHLVNLVNDFLNMSRIEQGKLEVEKKPFDMVALTDEVIKELADLAKDHKLYMQHEPFVGERRTVIADRTKAKEVLTNLISNGIKYTLQGGVTISHEENNVLFTTNVTDTGSGIEPESQHMLFGRFAQIGSSRVQSTTKSTGLGLYISKKIAQRMGGDVFLTRSEPSRGSTFTFTLPMR
jgi:two-component system, OmpR family, sensor histidine kinase VicK